MLNGYRRASSIKEGFLEEDGLERGRGQSGAVVPKKGGLTHEFHLLPEGRGSLWVSLNTVIDAPDMMM